MGIRSRLRQTLGRMLGRSRPVEPLPEDVLQTASAQERHASEIIEDLLDAEPVVLFLRGTPEQPADADARRIVAAMQEAGVERYAHLDCVAHDEAWQCLKDVAGTPTFPLLYVGRKVFGGVQAVEERPAELRRRVASARADHTDA